ncbi:MAG: metallophosphoesterase [Acidobacteria bacterium]|nr:metallophosphoesterase [Acidobacteriota bacterium]MBI3280147.1 metallophosphoesterase [Acidobacteriota bacterium]
MPILTLPESSRRRFLGVAAGGGIALARGFGAQARSTRWALLADTHLAADKTNQYRGFRPHDNLGRVIPEVVRSRPEGVLIDGDLARLEGQRGDYELLHVLLQPILEDTPVCLSLGNHDDRRNFLPVFARASPGQVQPVKDKHVLVFERPPVRFVVLDSLLYVNRVAGLLGKEQRAWLDGYLRSASEVPTIVVVHHTLDDADGSLLDADRLFRLVTPVRSVKAILYGHSHRYHFDSLEGIHLINLPAVGYNFNDREPVGWVDATLSAEGGDFTLHAIGGNTERDGKTMSLRWRA